MKPLIPSLLFAFFVCSTASAADLSGTWSYKTSGSWKKGPCPIGKDGPGKIKITKKGKFYELVFVSGRVCKPKSMCTFAGKPAGKKWTFANAAKVDNEGGKVVNRIELTVKSAKAATGSGTSSYNHPGGMTCKWGAKIALSR